ncbi:MAG: hypothetical protein ACKVP0_15390 [Pirellulaceae bacterium]
MASRTQIVCLHEGERGRSIDPVFINSLLKALKLPWVRPWKGSNVIRSVNGKGRKNLIEQMPKELKACLQAGGDTTLIVWADLDDDMANGDELVEAFRKVARSNGVTDEEFKQVVFIFAKDRLENWIEYLMTGKTDETVEGPRLKHNREAVDAAKTLAERCKKQGVEPPLPPSLEWSCKNWRSLVKRMRDS